METNVSKCLLTQMCEFLKQTNQEEDFIKMLKKTQKMKNRLKRKYVWLSLLLNSCEICPMSLLKKEAKKKVNCRLLNKEADL